MSFNLIDEKWIPIRRESGALDWIAPWQASETGDRPVGLASARPDFKGALIQFLIGLVQTAMAPKDELEWKRYLKSPPTPGELKTAFSKVAYAFNLDGDGPKFMQDFSPMRRGKGKNSESPLDIEMLIIDMPQENTRDKNRDHFNKRGQIPHLCMRCAAAALFSLQTNAPAGGPGYRVSVRGGGPLTTIILGSDLWRTIWLNVLGLDDFWNVCGNKDKRDPADIFPWMRPTRTSRNHEEMRPMEANPAQMFWGMPWRIWLLSPEEGAESCSVCGETQSPMVRKFVKDNYGVNYVGWRHTLSPYETKDGENQPFHGHKRGGLFYKHWLGLVTSDTQNNRFIAPIVEAFFSRYARWPDFHADLKLFPILWAFGYQMGQRDAECWHEGRIPLTVVEESYRDDYDEIGHRLISVAGDAANLLHKKVKEALFRQGTGSKGDLSFVDSRFWKDTERDFYSKLHECHGGLKEGRSLELTKLDWLKVLQNTAVRVFEDVTQTLQIDATNPKRVATALLGLQDGVSENNVSIRRKLNLAKKKGRKEL
jgi:CRISPR system Cascade subunit CasA